MTVIGTDEAAAIESVAKVRRERERAGFKLVQNPIMGGYAEGFDRNEEYEFWRFGWDTSVIFRLSDQYPEFNVWALMYRPLDTPAPKG